MEQTRYAEASRNAMDSQQGIDEEKFTRQVTRDSPTIEQIQFAAEPFVKYNTPYMFKQVKGNFALFRIPSGTLFGEVTAKDMMALLLRWEGENKLSEEESSSLADAMSSPLKKRKAEITKLYESVKWKYE